MPDEAAGNGGTPDAQGGTPELTYDTWLAGQDDTVKGLLDKHTGGLRTALHTERENAKTLAKQVKDLAAKADASTEAGKQLVDLSGKLESAEKRAAFVEEAAAAGCRNVKLAWLAASADGLTLKQVQEQHPDLFAPQRPPTHAGNGAQQGGGGQAKSMNAFIRRSAGRGG